MKISYNTPLTDEAFADTKRSYLIVRLFGFNHEDMNRPSQVNNIEWALTLENIEDNGLTFMGKLDGINKVKWWNLLCEDTKEQVTERLQKGNGIRLLPFDIYKDCIKYLK